MTTIEPGSANSGHAPQPDVTDEKSQSETGPSATLGAQQHNGPKTPSLAPSSPPMLGLSRNASFSGSYTSYDDDSPFPPLDRLTVFDLLENLALPQRLEQIQNNVTERVRRQQQRLRSGGKSAREKVIEEWRRRVPTPDEQLEKYRRRMRQSVDKIGAQWNDRKTVTVREKLAFIAAVFNILISGYLIGSRPERFVYWYAAQLAYFMPIRWYTYHQKGYHYFLADLCYFVNLLVVLSVWVFPESKRLMISTFCLAFGNNAVAIAMWRNMLVFHSLDKVTSLFIHIMPCVTLHCLVHLIPPELQEKSYPAIYQVKTAPRHSPYHYSPFEMLLWASLPYVLWQAAYWFFITFRRADKIAAGRLTSFVWLRRSYSKNFLGRFVSGLPESLQEVAFMGIQYCYAMLTTVPCFLWFRYRWMSGLFLVTMFGLSVYSGATYYIEIFGRRFEKELEQLRKDVERGQRSPGGMKTPSLSPEDDGTELKTTHSAEARHERNESESETSTAGAETKNGDAVESFPLLDEETKDKVEDPNGASLAEKKNS